MLDLLHQKSEIPKKRVQKGVQKMFTQWPKA
jgi:hypothetical protein